MVAGRRSTRNAFCVFLLVVVFLGLEARGLLAEQRFAVIVSGATGGQEYATQYTAWTDAMSRLFSGKYKFDPAAVTVLTESDAPAASATADNVRKVLTGIRERMTREDLLIIVLIGHGTFDGVDAKFNLVGRDLESGEWAALLRPLPGRVVVVNTTAGSFPFIERLAAPRRIIITATDSVAQRFDTVFPEYLSGPSTTNQPISTRTSGYRCGRHSRPPARASAAIISSEGSSQPNAR